MFFDFRVKLLLRISAIALIIAIITLIITPVYFYLSELREAVYRDVVPTILLRLPHSS